MCTNDEDVEDLEDGEEEDLEDDKAEPLHRVSVPIYLGVTFVLLTTVAYPSLGLCITPEVDDIRNVVDPEPKFIVDARGKNIGDVAPCDVLTVIRTRSTPQQS